MAAFIAAIAVELLSVDTVNQTSVLYQLRGKNAVRIKLAMLTELSWMSQTSLQSKRNFCGRVLNTILVKVIAAIFDFLQQRSAGERKKFVPRG